MFIIRVVESDTYKGITMRLGKIFKLKANSMSLIIFDQKVNFHVNIKFKSIWRKTFINICLSCKPCMAFYACYSRKYPWYMTWFIYYNLWYHITQKVSSVSAPFNCCTYMLNSLLYRRLNCKKGWATSVWKNKTWKTISLVFLVILKTILSHDFFPGLKNAMRQSPSLK